MALHDNIRTLRELNHWSQEEMAERINMSKNGYAKIERGETQPNISRLKKIAEAFEVDLVELLQSEEKGIFCLISENSIHNSNYYSSNQALASENEKLNLMLAHKDELLAQQRSMIAQKDSEIATLKTLVATLQMNIKLSDT